MANRYEELAMEIAARAAQNISEAAAGDACVLMYAVILPTILEVRGATVKEIAATVEKAGLNAVAAGIRSVFLNEDGTVKVRQ